jgi:hypothetical protein
VRGAQVREKVVPELEKLGIELINVSKQGC